MSTGIDVSSHQGNPDWGTVRGAGIEFAYIKASEGVGWTSPTLDSQFQGARGAGLAPGLYHFARPDTGNAPTAEADSFARHLHRLGAHGPGFLPPCLDIELTGGDLRAWCAAFVARLRDRLGRHRVMVYASTNFLLGHLGEPWADANNIWWWVAHYGRAPGQPGHVTPRVVMHQYTSSGRVNGIAGSVDMNRAMRPLSELTEGEDDMFTEDDRRRLVEIYEWWQHGIEGVRHAGAQALALYRVEQRLIEVHRLVEELKPTVATVVREALGDADPERVEQLVNRLTEKLDETAQRARPDTAGNGEASREQAAS
ncbi:hypothetical protein GCM10012275_35230 [Longimycelium tulufanense]|uniref:Lysozyme n=1 Tax=Longimycelium tulufanense TaxID=907463 RepID=A0A8J3FXC9_9PSEU|nr:glycoside hydrolase family 25 protein [Longimycelium tulufanense]GGM61128.1 hypothetical protein GCM10012275_35230 [Longimycelium tulufanense]